MEKKIQIPLHTVLLTIGPSCCGKSYLCENFIVPQLSKETSVVYLSSDNLRREILLDPNIGKHDERMNYASEQAFQLLYIKLKAHTSYPMNAGVVIVDTTGLDKRFRDDVIAIAKENNYNIGCVIFDYKGKEPYLRNLPDRGGYNSKQIVLKHIEMLRETVFKEIHKKDFEVFERIKEYDFTGIEFSMKNNNTENKLNGKIDNYIIVGDIHGCLDEFKQLIKKCEFEIDENDMISHKNENMKLVLVGDYVDKGYDIPGTINFIHRNLSWFHLVLGNHENLCFRVLKGSVSKKQVGDIVDDFFQSIEILEANEELKAKFFELIDVSKEFYEHENFIVTHAPCKRKYLGKMDVKSLKAQRNFIYPRRKDYKDEEIYFDEILKTFSFLKEEARGNQPFHVFGHVATESSERFKNKICIDTGCASKNRLSAVTFTKNYSPFFSHANSHTNEKIVEEKCVSIFGNKLIGSVDIRMIEPRDRGRIYYASKNQKVNYISGTVCPTDKCLETNELENLKWGLDYYRDHKINKLILQTKYMGSRANVYLFNDIERCYSVSRNGYHIDDRVDLKSIYKTLLERPQIRKEFDENGLEMMLIDGELMPWSSLGKDLIARDFSTNGACVENEIKFLKENGFDEAIFGLREDEDFQKYLSLKTEKTQKELVEIFGQHKERTFQHFSRYNFTHITVDDLERGLAIFNEQMILFGSDGDVFLKPFSLLKYVYKDFSEKLFFEETNESVFSFLSDDEYCVVDLNEEGALLKATEFFNKQTSDLKREGIVIKPEKIYNKGVAPYLKMRNPRYLTIIYGANYLSEHKFKKLISKKYIKSKLSVSIKQFEIGKKLLEIPYNEINKENQQFISTFHAMICEEKGEKFLDPRL